MRLALIALALIALLALPASASAEWFPGEAVDGPNADVVSLGDVDLARDGTGGVVYLRRDGAETHVYLSRMLDGAFRAPERVDVGLPGEATAATVAAGDGARLALSFVTGGRLFGAFAPGGGKPQPLSAPQLLVEGSPAAPVTDPHADLGSNSTAYVVFAARGDVGAARLSKANAWEVLPAPLDVDPPRDAGAGSSRPRVGVSAEGNAVATWGETHADGRRRVYGRRLTGLALSAVPQEISLPELPGAGLGGPADSPDIDIEDDGSYAWVAVRQDFGGVSRTFARRLVGSQFELPTALDGGQPSSAPRFDMNGRGIGASVVATPGGTVFGGLLDAADTLLGFARADSAGSDGAPVPAVATSERRTVATVYRAEAGGAGRILGRQKPDDPKKTGRPVVPFDPEKLLSIPDGGAVGAPEVSGNNNGDFAAAFVQGPPEARRLVVSVWDKPPGLPVGRSTDRFQRRRQPILKWGAGKDLWGAQAFRVFVNDALIATTDRTQALVPAPLPDGAHAWRVESTDRRGQVVSSRPRLLRIDTVAPKLRVRITGTRKARRTLKVRVTASDGRGGSGIKTVSVDYGDRSTPSKSRTSSHSYRRGTYMLRVRIADKARNVARKSIRLRIGR